MHPFMAGSARRLARFARCRRGAVAIIAALCLPALIGGLGLGAEIGYWRMLDRKLQHVADAAAQAAALRRGEGAEQDEMEAAARSIAEGSGFPDLEPKVAIFPAAEGEDAERVEVTLELEVERLFTRIFLDEPVAIAARAAVMAAPPEAPAGDCLLALSRNAPAALHVTGGSALTLKGCGARSNSAAADSILVEQGGALKASCAETTGGVRFVWTRPALDCEDVEEWGEPAADPYADLTDPPMGGPCDYPGTTTLGSWAAPLTLTPTRAHPGGGAAMRFCGDATLAGDVILQPGLYIFEGALRVGDAHSLSGEGVTIFMRKGGVEFGASRISLSAPAEGAYAGVVLSSGRSNTSQHRISNGNVSALEGAVHLPAGRLDIGGGASFSGSCAPIVADTIEINNGARLEIDCGESAGSLGAALMNFLK